MTDVDLAILGGTVITAEGRRRAHVYVHEGRVVAVDQRDRTARDTVDAGGLLVMPGGVDSHVHLMDPGSTDREDFPTGTLAAARAGTTTIIEHAHGHPVRTAADLAAKRDHLRGRANVDYALAAHAWPGSAEQTAEQTAGQVAELWRAGVAFFKVFTCTTHGIPGHTAGALRDHLRATAELDAVSLIHCEDESITESAERLLRAEDRTDPGLLPEWRNRDAEVVAAAVTALLVRRTGARATVAHVSHPEVADHLSRERASGARLLAETCPQYLLLREPEIHQHGPFRKFTPPARARTDADEAEMWRLLRTGALTHLSTDHAPATREQKTGGGFWDVHFGLPGLDSTMALLLDAAARQHLAHEDIARLYSEIPARWYGLWPRKGRIAPGFDADLLLVDPAARTTLRDQDVISKAGWTPYHGRHVTGRVLNTYLRGTLISDDGRPTDQRGGRFLPGPGAVRR